MREASERCIAAIKAFEGFRAEAYQDASGVWTVGYGWTLGVHAGTWMSETAADHVLRARLAQIALTIPEDVHVALTEAQFDAVCDFEYNLGRGAFTSSTLLAKLNAGDYAGAAAEFPRWCHAGDQVLPGLLKRRLIEQAWFTEAAA